MSKTLMLLGWILWTYSAPPYSVRCDKQVPDNSCGQPGVFFTWRAVEGFDTKAQCLTALTIMPTRQERLLRVVQEGHRWRRDYSDDVMRVECWPVGHIPRGGGAPTPP